MKTALILSGGGARAAYQAGVMRGVLEVYGNSRMPFDVVCGTSAGAINAVYLAANAHRPLEGIESLCDAWRGIRAGDVYDPSWRAVLGNLMRVVLAPFRSSVRGAPTSILDNRPLRHMLADWLDFNAARENLRAGLLENLCITAMDYASGASVAFYEGMDVSPWDRLYRRGVQTSLDLDHVMASAAIPILFPAQRIGARYFGDGALRQLHPISPALKFGATRLFIIGVSAGGAGALEKPHMLERRRPSIGQMAGHLLNREFIDNLEADIELARRINELSTKLPLAEQERMGTQHIETLVITPSVHFNELAASYIDKQPRSLQFLFRLMGTSRRGAGASFASYLMFDGGFCAELIDMGYRDACNERERVREFLRGGADADTGNATVLRAKGTAA
jgi:NTE family protein